MHCDLSLDCLAKLVLKGDHNLYNVHVCGNFMLFQFHGHNGTAKIKNYKIVSFLTKYL